MRITPRVWMALTHGEQMAVLSYAVVRKNRKRWEKKKKAAV